MRILLIEDDVDLSRSLSAMLERQNFSVTTCTDGEEGLFYIQEDSHDLVLLDRMLPGIDGMEVLKKARAAGYTVPIIFLTAVGSVGDRVTGLDCGADDYIVKPFAFEELMARTRCVCRRPQRMTDSEFPSFGDICYNPAQSLLKCGEKSCTLSRREGELLLLFLNNPDQLLPRGLILSRVWGPDAEIEDGNLDNYIHFLRRRLRAVESRLALKTARGIGYRLTDTRTQE